jgi:hypothetical protein
MLNLIYGFYKKFLDTTKDSKSKTDSVDPVNKDIFVINFVLDCGAQELVLTVDVFPYDINDPRMVSQAENFARLLFKVSKNNTYVTELILENLQIIKQKSEKNSLFVTNVLFFWQHLLESQKMELEDIPVIRPISVFKNIN